jgi:hypothetical protein
VWTLQQVQAPPTGGRQFFLQPIFHRIDFASSVQEGQVAFSPPVTDRDVQACGIHEDTLFWLGQYVDLKEGLGNRTKPDATPGAIPSHAMGRLQFEFGAVREGVMAI